MALRHNGGRTAPTWSRAVLAMCVAVAAVGCAVDDLPEGEFALRGSMVRATAATVTFEDDRTGTLAIESYVGFRCDARGCQVCRRAAPRRYQQSGAYVVDRALFTVSSTATSCAGDSVAAVLRRAGELVACVRFRATPPPCGDIAPLIRDGGAGVDSGPRADAGARMDAGPTSDPCAAAAASCASCTAVSSCGYCGGRCMTGTASGPSAGTCAGAAWIWLSSGCRAVGSDAGVTDAPPTTTSCAGAANGLYCGGNGVPGDPNTLYRCTSGALTVAQVCAAGCSRQPAGVNDFCATTGPTCASGTSTAATGWSCAWSLYGGAQYWTCGDPTRGRGVTGTRYRCSGTTAVAERCATACAVSSLGQNDCCR